MSDILKGGIWLALYIWMTVIGPDAKHATRTSLLLSVHSLRGSLVSHICNAPGRVVTGIRRTRGSTATRSRQEEMSGNEERTNERTKERTIG